MHPRTNRFSHCRHSVCVCMYVCMHMQDAVSSARSLSLELLQSSPRTSNSPVPAAYGAARRVKPPPLPPPPLPRRRKIPALPQLACPSSDSGTVQHRLPLPWRINCWTGRPNTLPSPRLFLGLSLHPRLQAPWLISKHRNPNCAARVGPDTTRSSRKEETGTSVPKIGVPRILMVGQTFEQISSLSASPTRTPPWAPQA